MRALISFSNGIDAISRKFGQLADYLVLLCALVSAGNAGIRYLFSISSNGWLEIQWYMFGAIVLLGSSHTLRKNEHVRVDLIYGSVSDRARLWIDVIGIVLFLLPITAYFAWICWPFFYASLPGLTEIRSMLTWNIWAFFVNLFHSGEMSQNAGGLARWPAKLMLVSGFSLLFLQGISELIKRIAGLIGVLQIETKYEKPLQ
jgi:TRAP-type mannitol/chloroaromatic compound transport system permease small subunit